MLYVKSSQSRQGNIFRLSFIHNTKMMAALSTVMNGSNAGDVKEKWSAPNMPFYQLSERKHTRKSRESV